METVPIFRQLTLTTMFEENLGAARKNLLAASFSKRRPAGKVEERRELESFYHLGVQQQQQGPVDERVLLRSVGRTPLA